MIRDVAISVIRSRTARSFGLWVSILALAAVSHKTASAAPAKKSAIPAPVPAGWIKHRVIPGELLAEIGLRYAVSVDAIIRWNNLNKDRLIIRAGQQLRIKTDLNPPPREKVLYLVQRGDSWERIAKKHHISVKRLRIWNADRPEHLLPGQTLAVWTEEKSAPQKPEVKSADRRPLPIVAVQGSSLSVGCPNRGRLSGSVLLPENPKLYTRRNSFNSYGSTHMIELIQETLAAFRRNTGFDREVLICDMSRKNGGKFRPHSSHQSGRDVDIQLPCRPEVKAGTVPWSTSQVDWDATWGLVKALIDTGQVEYIFLVRERQEPLYRAAQRAGESPAYLDRAIQYPRSARVGIVRHDKGHIKHMHVRFQCGPNEPQCSH